MFKSTRSGFCKVPSESVFSATDRVAVEPGLVSPIALHRSLFKLAEEKLSRGVKTYEKLPFYDNHSCLASMTHMNYADTLSVRKSLMSVTHY